MSLPDVVDITDDDLEAAGKTVRNNIKVLRKYADTTPRGPIPPTAMGRPRYSGISRCSIDA